MRVALLSDTKTKSSCWTRYATDFLKQYQVAGLGMVLIVFGKFNLTEQWGSPFYETLKQYQVAGLGTLLIFIFFFCHPTIRVAVLLEFETLSGCWTWYGTDFFLCFFNLSEQWESPHYQTLKQYQVAGLSMVMMFFCVFNLTEQWGSPCYETLKKYQVAGLGTLLIFIFFFCHPTIRVAVLLEFETISGCWTWYGTDFFLCFFNLSEQWESPHYQTLKQYQVAGLSMVMMFFCVFNLTEQWGSPCYETLKQYQVAGLGTLLVFIFFFCHPTIRVAVLLEFETISGCWTWYSTDFFLCFFNLSEQWESPHYQTLKQYQVAGLSMVMMFFCVFNLTEQWGSPCYETL